MPTLMGLPNEILSSIIKAIEPEDIESFSTCCKLMYSLARQRLEEHKEKKRLFSNISVEEYFSPFSKPLRGGRDVQSNTQLREFFSDERNRVYPKAMAVSLDTYGSVITDKYVDSPTASIPAVNGLDEVEQQLESRMAEVYSMIGLEVGGIDSKLWGRHVKLGYPIGTFLLLLALLPNLEMLSLEVLGYWHSTSSPNYARIMKLMTENALERRENGLSFGGRLSNCKVNGEFLEGIEESLLPLFMVLPSMRKVEGYCLTMENYSWPYADAVSSVADLDLHGAIDDVTLSSHIRGIKELKRFCFLYASHGYILWDPCGIVATLRQFAFRSLVYLSLTTEMAFEASWLESSLHIGSLRSFEVLETVRLHYILLIEEVRTVHSTDVVNWEQTLKDLLDKSLVKVKFQKLIDFLPSSVKVFELEEFSGGGPILDTFEGFLEHRAERLPNLRLLDFDTDAEINSQIKEICNKAGVWIK